MSALIDRELADFSCQRPDAALPSLLTRALQQMRCCGGPLRAAGPRAVITKPSVEVHVRPERPSRPARQELESAAGTQQLPLLPAFGHDGPYI